MNVAMAMKFPAMRAALSMWYVPRALAQIPASDSYRGSARSALYCVWPANASNEYCEVLEGFGRERAKDGSHWSWRGWQYATARVDLQDGEWV
jgi:hypothetical protein